MFDAFQVEWRAIIGICRLLGIGDVGDGGMIVRRELGLGGSQVDVADEEFFDVAWHGHAESAFGVVTVKVHADEFGTLPVLSDGVVLLEDVAEVKCMAFYDVLNAKVIGNDGEQDRLPLMYPEARCGGSLVVAGFVEEFGEEVIDKLSRLRKAVDTFENLKLDPDIAVFVGNVVLLEKSLGI